MSITTDVRNRLLLICAAIELPGSLSTPKVYETIEECSFAAADLPAFVVEDSPEETYSRMNDQVYTSQGEFFILLYVSQICDESYRKNVDAWDLVRDCMVTVTDYFAAKPTLAFNDAGIVIAAQISRGRKMTLGTKGSTTKYHGASFRLSFANTRRVDQYDGE